MPERFRGIAMPHLSPTDIWLPLSAAPSLRLPLDRDDDLGRLHLTARLRAGFTIAQAQSLLTVIAKRLDGTHVPPAGGPNGPWQGSHRFWLRSFGADVTLGGYYDEQFDSAGRIGLFCVLVLYCLLCYSITSLSMARWVGEARDTAIRIALGATVSHLVLHAAAEAVVLVGAGLAVGGLVTLWACGVLSAYARSMIYFTDGFAIVPTPQAWGILLVAGSIAGTWLSVSPALIQQGFAWRDVGHGITMGRWRLVRVFRGLLVAHVTFTAVLAVCACAFAGELYSLLRHDTGMDLERVAVIGVDFRGQEIEPTRARALALRMLNGIERQVVTESAALASGLPLGRTVRDIGRVTVPDRPLTEEYIGEGAVVLVGTPMLFRVLGIAIDDGSDFERATPGPLPIAVISESLARRLYGSANAVGQVVVVRRQGFEGEPRPKPMSLMIAGVAEDTDTLQIGSRAHGTVYLPYAQNDERFPAFLVRTTRSPSAAIPLLRSSVSGESDVAVVEADDALDLAGASAHFLTAAIALVSGLAVFAQGLAATTLFALLGISMSWKRRDTAIRRALGASRPSVAGLMLAENLRPVVVGVGLGGMVSGLVWRSLRHLVPSLSVSSVSGAYLGVATGSLLIAALVVVVPALRLSAVEPWTILREPE